MEAKAVTFQEFKDFSSGLKYEGTDLWYPPLPAPAYTIDGVPYWDRESLISFGRAVEQCHPNLGS